MDEKMERLEQLISTHKEKLLEMKLIPEIWVRKEGSNVWSEWI
jgi:hypothetical protein